VEIAHLWPFVAISTPELCHGVLKFLLWTDMLWCHAQLPNVALTCGGSTCEVRNAPPVGGLHWSWFDISRQTLYNLRNDVIVKQATPWSRVLLERLIVPQSWNSLIVGTPAVHCRVNKSSPFDRILCQINPVHTLPSCLLKMYFDVFLSASCSLE
jgi:hypothetical protein